MRGLGKLVAMLNPLDQAAASQIWKAGKASGGLLGGVLGVGRAGANQVLSRNYWQGRNMAMSATGRLRQRSIGNIGLGGREPTMGGLKAAAVGARPGTQDVARLRRTAGAIGGAWMGLNLLAPDSNITGGANTVAMAAGVLGAGKMIGNKWGRGASTMWYGGAGAAALGRMTGVI